MTVCECGNPKEHSATACGRCLEIEGNLWRWLRMTGRTERKLRTESEQGRLRFESRFAGLQRRKPKTGRRAPGLDIKPKGVARPRDFEWPLPDGVVMTLAQAADDTRHASGRVMGAI